jgi:hypothetical protein
MKRIVIAAGLALVLASCRQVEPLGMDGGVDSGPADASADGGDAGPDAGDGVPWWHTFYGSSDQPNSSADSGNALAIDGSGNVYVTGCSFYAWNGPNGESPLHHFTTPGYGDNTANVFVLKLDPSGAYQWHTFYGSGKGDCGHSLAIDGSGNIHVTGYSDARWNGPSGESPLHPFSGSNGYTDIFVLKLDSNGAYRWHTFYGSGDDDDKGKSLAIDGCGNICLTGSSWSSWDGPGGKSPLHAFSGSGNVEDSNLFVLKLGSNGDYQWHTFYGSSIGSNYGDSIAIDGSGNLYVAGDSDQSWNGPGDKSSLHAFSGSGGYYSVFVLKLGSSGAYQWHTFYGSNCANSYYVGSNGANSLAMDGSGNLYVAGECYAGWNGPGGESPLYAFSGVSDFFVLKLDSGGVYGWHSFYSDEADSVGSLTLDGAGSLYITGDSWDPWNGPNGESPLHPYSHFADIFVLKLGPSGTYEWHAFYGSFDVDYGNSLAIDGSGDICVAGSSGASWPGPNGESPLHPYQGLHPGYPNIVVFKMRQ